MSTVHKTLLCIALGTVFGSNAIAQDEFLEWDELKVIVEINATDGDVGFHVLADAGPWQWLEGLDPDGNTILEMRALGALRAQGITEEFFESSEPLCEPDDEEPDERVVTLAEFVGRFAEGEYFFRANTIDGNRVRGATDFTYNLPAAPDIDLTDEATLPAGNVVIMWAPGDDLGEACSDEDLVASGAIADPATVPVVAWELVVEVDDDDAPDLVYSAQVPPEQTAVMVPNEFMQPFLDMGFSEFKFEIGAIEESGNQTFSEGSFEVE